MTVSHIPPRDPNEARLTRIKATLSEVLRPYVSGKNKDEKLAEAVTKSIEAIRPLLKLQKEPKLGATVMTEGATKNQQGFIAKGPTNL